MAKFTISACVRMPRGYHLTGSGKVEPWYYYLLDGAGKVPAEYHIYLTGVVDINGTPTNVMGTQYAPAGSAVVGDEKYVGRRLSFFPPGIPDFTVTPPKGDDFEKSCPIDKHGIPKSVDINGKQYAVPLSAVRAVYTTIPYWLDLDDDEIIVKSLDGSYMKTADGSKIMVRIMLKHDIEPRLRAPIRGFEVSDYEDEGRNKVRVALHKRTVNIIRGKVVFKDT